MHLFCFISGSFALFVWCTHTFHTSLSSHKHWSAYSDSLACTLYSPNHLVLVSTSWLSSSYLFSTYHNCLLSIFTEGPGHRNQWPVHLLTQREHQRFETGRHRADELIPPLEEQVPLWVYSLQAPHHLWKGNIPPLSSPLSLGNPILPVLSPTSSPTPPGTTHRIWSIRLCLSGFLLCFALSLKNGSYSGHGRRGGVWGWGQRDGVPGLSFTPDWNSIITKSITQKSPWLFCVPKNQF